MQFVPLISIPVFFFLAILLKKYLPVCAICFAVSLTWLLLLVFWFFGFSVSLLQLGILMGMSVSGLMYKLEGIYKKLQIRNFWFVRLVLIVGGFYLIFLLLEENLSWFVLLFVLNLLLIFLATFFFQGSDGVQDTARKKLEDCC